MTPRVVGGGFVRFGRRFWLDVPLRGLHGALLVQLLGRKRSKGQRLVPVEQLRAPIEMGSHDDFVLGFGQGLIVFKDLEVTVFVTDAPVVLENAAFLEAEHVIQRDASRQSSMKVLFASRSNRESSVQTVREAVLEQLVGRGDRRDPAQGEFFDQAVLVSPVGAFDAALTLSRQMPLVRRVKRFFSASPIHFTRFSAASTSLSLAA